MNFNKNSIGNRSRPVVWNGNIYPSGCALQRALGYKSSGSISQALRLDRAAKGHYIDYVIENKT